MLLPFASIRRHENCFDTPQEGLVDEASINSGIRAPLLRRRKDREHDGRRGFPNMTASKIDKSGMQSIILEKKNSPAR